VLPAAAKRNSGKSAAAVVGRGEGLRACRSAEDALQEYRWLYCIRHSGKANKPLMTHEQFEERIPVAYEYTALES
jgi:hypothetical protein